MQKKLNIQLLGDFALEYDGKRIQLGNSYRTKVFQLLQVLLYHGAEGITTSVLIDQPVSYTHLAAPSAGKNVRSWSISGRRMP